MLLNLDVFKAIFENSAAPTAVFNLDTTIAMANSAYCRVSGLSMDEVIGISWLAQIPPDDIERLKEYNKTRLTGSEDVPAEYDFSFYNKQGDRKHGHTFVKLIKEHSLIICSFVDTTEKNAAEILIEEQRKELKLRMQQLDKELAFKIIQVTEFNKHNTWLTDNLLTLRQKLKTECVSFLPDIDRLLDVVKQQQRDFSTVKLDDNFLRSQPKFMQGLLDKHPQLTPAEIKLCTLLHLNLNSSEIAVLTSLTQNSVKVARTRLRKKLKLSKDDGLTSYLMQF